MVLLLTAEPEHTALTVCICLSENDTKRLMIGLKKTYRSQDKEHVRGVYAVTAGQADKSGLHVPSSGHPETLQPGEKGNKIPAGQEKRGDGVNGANLIEVTSWPSRYPRQPDMMS